MTVGFILIFQISIFAYGWYMAKNKYSRSHLIVKLPLPVRILLSASLLISSYLIYNSSTGNTGIYSRWVFYGMLLSFIGDIAMAGLIPLMDKMITGIISFSIAHFLYINAYIRIISIMGFSLVNAFFLIPLIFYSIFSAGGWYFFIRNPQKDKIINLISLIYGLLIGIMASSALVLALLLKGTWWATAAGASSFVISDFIIGITTIGTHKLKDSEIFVWLTYVLGQIGIIYSPWLLSLTI